MKTGFWEYYNPMKKQSVKNNPAFFMVGTPAYTNAHKSQPFDRDCSIVDSNAKPPLSPPAPGGTRGHVPW